MAPQKFHLNPTTEVQNYQKCFRSNKAPELVIRPYDLKLIDTAYIKRIRKEAIS